MGLRDRDYTRPVYSDDQNRRPYQTDVRSAAGIIVFINCALWLANGLLFPNNSLTELLLLHVKSAGYLANCYRFLTYGFVHSPFDWMHITFNMLGLLMFGYGVMLGIGPNGFGFVRGVSVEGRLGRLEFTTFYLLTILVGGFVYTLSNLDNVEASCLGASGGVCGVVILYAWLFPRKTLLLWGILPMPMWALGVLIVSMDAYGAAGFSGGRVAYSVHLTGAAIATLYYFVFLRSGKRLTDRHKSPSDSKRQPKLRIHTSEDFSTDSSPTDEEFGKRLDEILKRYGEVGESGLTSEEREFLQNASRRFSDKNRN